ncbi:hypothetical protein ACQP3F_29205, partial [Escherichia coli]
KKKFYLLTLSKLHHHASWLSLLFPCKKENGTMISKGKQTKTKAHEEMGKTPASQDKNKCGWVSCLSMTLLLLSLGLVGLLFSSSHSQHFLLSVA